MSKVYTAAPQQVLSHVPAIGRFDCILLLSSSARSTVTPSCACTCDLEAAFCVLDSHVSLVLAAANFNDHYQSLDPDKYYVKLDDDSMYVGPHAIDMMLHEKLRDRFFIVSANVINHSGESVSSTLLCCFLHLSFR